MQRGTRIVKELEFVLYKEWLKEMRRRKDLGEVEQNGHLQQFEEL